MVPNYISIVSMNYQGLSNRENRSDTLFFLKSKNILFTSYKTLILQLKKKNIRTQWGFECYFNNFSSQARSVAILFNNNFEFKVLKTVRDEISNKFILKVIIKGKRLTLINIYGPNLIMTLTFTKNN